MSLYVLVVCLPQSVTEVEWYFDNHMHFIRAEALAKELGIFVRKRSDFISDLSEFTHFLGLNGMESSV